MQVPGVKTPLVHVEAEQLKPGLGVCVQLVSEILVPQFPEFWAFDSKAVESQVGGGCLNFFHTLYKSSSCDVHSG